jgi:hypothetical protein
MQGEVVGKVIEQSTPLKFRFRVAKGKDIPLHEFVFVNIGEDKKVLAEVISVGTRNPLATESLTVEESAESDMYSYEVAEAEVLGYLEDGRLLRPKIAPKPNAQVYKADDESLQRFFKGDDKRVPIYIGSLVHRKSVKVPIHIQDLQFHLGIFAQTRAGKSYLAGKIIEEILVNTPFPVIVIDIHGDYLMMDRDSITGQKHDKFDVVVYFPTGAKPLKGLSAEIRELKLTPRDLTNEAVIELIGHLGELQEIVIREKLSQLRGENRPFGSADLIHLLKEEVEREDNELDSATRKRYLSIITRLEDLQNDGVYLTPIGTQIKELLRPKQLTVICLRGMKARVQDSYTGLIVDLILRNQISNYGNHVLAPPTFLFIEEAHRVASRDVSSYGRRSISTAVREGAKFGLFLCFISQRPRSIDPDIMSNIGNYIVLRITNQQDQNMIEYASESFTRRLIEDLPALNQGEAVIVGPFTPIPAMIKTEDRLTMHFGVTPNLLTIKNSLEEMVRRRVEERW